MSKAVSPYQEFLETLGHLHKMPTLPSLMLFHGPSDYLVYKAQQSLKNRRSNQYYVVDAGELDAEKFANLWEQGSIFGERTFYFVRQAETRSDLARFLAAIPDAAAVKNHLCILYLGKSLPVKLTQELTRLEGYLVPCFEPAFGEIDSFIAALAKRHGLALTNSGVELLKETQGHDLFKLENEIQKLQLIFHERKEPLAGVDISPMLGMLREDHAFQLDRLLASGAYAKTHALVRELLDNGENAVALLGVLAMHCRKALKMHSCVQKGMQEREIATHLRLPFHAVKSYNSYIRRIQPKVFKKALVRCHEADSSLKSSGIGAAATLSDVISTLQRQPV